MNHQQKNRIEDYLNGTIREDEMRLLLERVEHDPGVALEVAKGRELVGMLRLIEADQDQEARAEQLMQAIRAEARAGEIANQVTSRLRRRLAWPVLAAAAVLIVMGAALLSRDVPPKKPTVVGVCSLVQVAGEVSVLRGSELLPVGEGDELLNGDWLVVGAGAATTRFTDQTTCTVERNSRLQIAETVVGKSLTLGYGSTFFSVAPQSDGKPAVILTGHAKIQVVGTSFQVRTDAEESVVEMRTGKVRMASMLDLERSVEVRAGESAIVKAGEAQVARILPVTKPSERVEAAFAAWRQQRQAWLSEEALVAYYDFERNHADTRGLLANHAGSLTRGREVPLNADARIFQAAWSRGRYWNLKGALFFDGQRSHLDAGTAVPRVLSGPMTVLVWFKVQAFSNQWQTVVGTGMRGFGIQRFEQTDVLQFYYWSDGAYHNADGKMPVRDGKWHCAVGVYDGKATRLYVDGQLDAAMPISGTLTSDDTPFLIGCNDNGSLTRHFCGWIDEVAVFNRALSPDEIAYVWESQRPE